MRTEGIATEVRSLRLNFAQVCVQCGERWCEDPSCVAKHARSHWMICDGCAGTMADDFGLPCGCLFGLVEACEPTYREPWPVSPSSWPVQIGGLAADPEHDDFMAWRAGYPLEPVGAVADR